MISFYIKTNRTFTTIRKYGYLFTFLVAIGGLWVPKLGLLVIPVMIGLILFSFYKGRYWCGNICAHGSLFDSLIYPISRNKKIPKLFKSKVLGIVFLGLFSYKLISKLIKVSAIYGSSSFLDKLGLIFVSSYLMVAIVGSFFAIIYSPRVWCNFCPMGTIQMITYKIGKKLGVTKVTDEKVTVTKSEMCHKCGKCSRVCPMQLMPYKEFSLQNQVDNEGCIRCSTCVENCPAGILTINNLSTAQLLNRKVSIKGYEDRVKIKAKLDNIIKLKEDTTEYTFKLLEPISINYKPGQFILVKIQDNPEMFRAYSISSYDDINNKVSVTIKRVKDGYGTDIISKDFKKGDLIELEGPMGNELVVDKKEEKVLLVAGGIGITPFVPIINDLLQESGNIKEFKLIYGVNNENEFLYENIFSDYENKSNKFEFIKVVAFDENWKGKKGFVTDVMKDMDLDNYKIYMCGPKPMINATLDMLHEANIDNKKVSYESA